jgi:hypothetical protein
MPISKAYKNTLKKRAIKKFVKTNSRAPTALELRDLVIREERNYPSVDVVGISGFDIEKPQYEDSSSAIKENTNRHALYDDMTTIGTRINDSIQLLEDSYRGFVGTTNRTRHALKQIEGRLDNLLLLNTDIDIFVYGVEEAFDFQDRIDFSQTDASIESGYVTMGRGGYQVLDLLESQITYSVVSENAVLNGVATTNIEHLKENDGSIWEYLVYTKNRLGRVSVLVDVDLLDSTYINDVRFTGSPISVNQHVVATLFYSLDGQVFLAHEPAEIALTTGEFQFNLGLEGVKKIRLMLSKSVADNAAEGNQYVYAFSLDSLQILTEKYTSNNVSTMVAGPYPVLDESGADVAFTKATLEACVIETEDSGVDFFLSKDGTSWEPVNFRSDGLNYASFGNGSIAATSGVIDVDIFATGLLAETDLTDDLDFKQEAVLNTYILEENVSDVSIKSIQIKRNTTGILTRSVYDVSPGWFFDPITSQYSTTVYVSDPAGRYIDFGPTGIYVNGTLTSGEILFAGGYSVVATSDSNWQSIATGLTTVQAIKQQDPLYPYNHKYLIEGYGYSQGFFGEKIYNGVEEYFGRLLTYVPPEHFNSETASGDYSIYTIDSSSGNLLFKVKVNKKDASWSSELFQTEWLVHGDTGNQLYVKAILKASDNGQSPVLEHFKVRVI